MSLLETYIGSWRGDGTLVGGQRPEPFRCRLTINKGNLNKVNYAGRCTLVDMNLSVSGTIAYDDKARRYQAVMSSNAGFKGTAVGRQSGDKITHINGKDLTDDMEAAQVYFSLGGTKVFKIRYVRGSAALLKTVVVV
jgi:hypothetical protein